MDSIRKHVGVIYEWGSSELSIVLQVSICFGNTADEVRLHVALPLDAQYSSWLKHEPRLFGHQLVGGRADVDLFWAATGLHTAGGVHTVCMYV